MTKVEAITYNNQRHNILGPISQGAAIGAVAGIVGKYTYPLIQDEKNTDEYIKVSRNIEAQKTAYNFRTEKFINSIKSQDKMSLAEDEFVKMFDGMKDGDKVKPGSIRTAIKNLSDNKKELFEFKRLCKTSALEAEKTAKQCMNAYNLVTKHIRPTGFFVAAGAVVGAFVAMINDILKTDVKH